MQSSTVPCDLLKKFRPVASQLKLKLAASFNLTMSIKDTCQEKIGFKNVYNGFIRNKGGPQHTVGTETRLGAIRMSENDELMQLKPRFIYGRAKRC